MATEKPNLPVMPVPFCPHGEPCFVLGLLDLWCVKFASWIWGHEGQIKRWLGIRFADAMRCMREKRNPATALSFFLVSIWHSLGWKT
jgi:hypothetical protein